MRFETDQEYEALDVIDGVRLHSVHVHWRRGLDSANGKRLVEAALRESFSSLNRLIFRTDEYKISIEVRI